MIAYVVRRVLAGLFLILSLGLATYVVFYTIPTNPACEVVDCGPGNHTTPEQLKAAEHEIGVDKPVLEQYGLVLWRIVDRGSLGHSFVGNESVNGIIERTLPVTASLVLGGAVLLLLLSVPLAIVAARHPRSLTDRGLLAVALIGIAVHPFVLGIGFRSLFAHHLGVAPSQGYCTLFSSSGCNGPADWAYHLYLPWITFALFFLPLYMRMIRGLLLETMGEQYVSAARAKGASEVRVMRKHVLRNAIPPVLALLAVDAGTAITAAIYVETIYGLPGIGHEAVVALTGQGGYDLPVVFGIVFTIAVAVTVLNMAADLAIAGLDPRVRLGEGTALLRLPAPVARLGARVPRRVSWALAGATALAVVGLFAWHVTHRGQAVAGSGAAPASLLDGPTRTIRAGWTESRPLQGGPMVFRVRSVEVGTSGWLVRGSVQNRSSQTFELVPGAAYPAAAGFSVIEPAPVVGVGEISGAGRGLQVHPASAFSPALPTELAPGEGWTGEFAGSGTLRRGILVYVGFGYFLPPGAPPPPVQAGFGGRADGFNWLTNNSFRVPR